MLSQSPPCYSKFISFVCKVVPTDMLATRSVGLLEIVNI